MVTADSLKQVVVIFDEGMTIEESLIATEAEGRRLEQEGKELFIQGVMTRGNVYTGCSAEGYNQRQIAELFNCSQSTIQHYSTIFKVITTSNQPRIIEEINELETVSKNKLLSIVNPKYATPKKAKTTTVVDLVKNGSGKMVTKDERIADLEAQLETEAERNPVVMDTKFADINNAVISGTAMDQFKKLDAPGRVEVVNAVEAFKKEITADLEVSMAETTDASTPVVGNYGELVAKAKAAYVDCYTNYSKETRSNFEDALFDIEAASMPSLETDADGDYLHSPDEVVDVLIHTVRTAAYTLVGKTTTAKVVGRKIESMKDKVFIYLDLIANIGRVEELEAELNKYLKENK